MYQDVIGLNANYRSFGSAFMVLVRCAAGEGWNTIMVELANTVGYNGVSCMAN
jgi:hypothetical protein